MMSISSCQCVFDLMQIASGGVIMDNQPILLGKGGMGIVGSGNTAGPIHEDQPHHVAINNDTLPLMLVDG